MEGEVMKRFRKKKKQSGFIKNSTPQEAIESYLKNILKKAAE